jgi:uncharacterized membrane protein YphA (DoxX/SURF4 family)
VSRLLANPRVQLVFRLLLGAMFVYASLDKIAHPAAFAKAVYQWQIGGPVFSNFVAVILPWVELAAGLLLLVGVWRREAALVVACLLVVFLVAAGSVLARGIDVENCGCVSVATQAADAAWPPKWMRGVGWYLVTRNIALLGAALTLVLVAPVPAVREGAAGDALRSEADALRNA